MLLWCINILLLLHAIHFTSVQLTTTADVSLNGYMVAPRDDTGTTPDESVPYVGSWESGTGVKLLCNGVSTSIYASFGTYITT